MTDVASRARPNPEVVRVATSFIGRDAELRATADLLLRHRLLTLTGAGGIGKTRLARELSAHVAPRFRDGVWVVELGTLHAGDDVAEAVVAAFGLTSSTTQDALPQLVAELAAADLLLVLDTCEHLLAGLRPVVDALLRSTAGVRVVATSREPLGIGGEHVVGVSPLPVPRADDPPADVDAARAIPAVRLLEDRAVAASSGFALDRHNLSDVVAIVARLDGLPLAIELAAVRLRSLGAADLLHRIGDRFAILTRGNETALPQHRSLQAMVEWSLDLCTVSERRLWAQLAVFAGGADLDAVLAVCEHGSSAGSVLDDLDSLVAKSVVTVEKVDGTTRYRLLETLAEFGRERLAAAVGDGDALRDRHAGHYRRQVTLAAARFWTRDQTAAVRQLVVEWANLRQAFEHLLVHRADDGRAALELAADLRIHWISLSMLREGRRWLDAALTAAPEPTPARARALFAAMWISAMQADGPASQRRIAEADTLVPTLDDPVVAHRVAMWKAVGAVFAGDAAGGVVELERCARWFLAAGDAEGSVVSLEMAAIGQSLLGRHDDAWATAERFLQLTVDNEDTWSRSYALWTRAHVAWCRGDATGAAAACRQSLLLKYEFGDHFGTATVLGVLAGAAWDLGEPDRAATLMGITSVVWGTAGAGYAALGPALGGRYEDVAVAARRRLGAEAYTAAYERGRALGAADARAFALGRPAGPTNPTDAADPADLADLADPVGPTSTRASLAAPLSPREAEVAGLVATGLSNREVADRLVVSPRTVEGHVERILAKLGFRSRVEIATWVVDARDRDAADREADTGA